MLFLSCYIIIQTIKLPSMEQIGQQQLEQQAIRLYEDGQSYSYQGAEYMLIQRQKCENIGMFKKGVTTFISKHKAIKLTTAFLRRNGGTHKEIITSRFATIKHFIQFIVMTNQNYELLLNVVNMHHSLTSMTKKSGNSRIIPALFDQIQDCLTYLMNEIDGDSELGTCLDERIRNRGIREARLFIEIIRKRLAYNREKMVLLSRILFARRVDSNAATIIYGYCI